MNALILSAIFLVPDFPFYKNKKGKITMITVQTVNHSTHRVGKDKRVR